MTDATRRLSGRNIIVTGASRGIGANLARRLAAEGANLFLVARSLEQPDNLPGSLNQTVDVCRAHGVSAEVYVADLTRPESRAGIVPAALEFFGGRIDVLVNNAAAAMYGTHADYPMKRMRLTYEINVFAPMELTQGVLPGMLERGEGWIVNLSSATAHHIPGPPYGEGTRIMGVYGSSKAALNRLTNAFAAELHGTGVRVNSIQPRAAVMSEGAEALVGATVRPDQIEPMEAMVESIVALCDCDADDTGGIHVSLDLIADRSLVVHDLDGRPLPA